MATAETAIVGTQHESATSPNHEAQSSETDPFIGRQLGHYRIVDCIGQGGMGRVYRAIDESLQRYVAVKVIHRGEGSSGDAELQKLFEEARAQARVNHANVAHIYFVGSESDTPFLAMELVGDSTLADELRNGPLPFAQIVRIAIQTVHALRQAARFDIVHRDVKPRNMLMVDRNTIKLSDFGMAQNLSAILNRKRSISGTPDYMAPEATRGEETDHRSDMYSLGVTLFEMTFGRLPYPSVGGDLSKRFHQHRESPVEFPEVWPQETPVIWKGVLQKLLAKDPADRYADFDELAEELHRVEPIERPRANFVLRGFALLLDWLLVTAVFSILGTIFDYLLPLSIQTAATGVMPEQPTPIFLLSLTGIWLQAVFLLFVGVLQAYWGTTPGKRLFQIRIVDLHGYRPVRTVLALRTLFQFPWHWTLLVAALSFTLFGLNIMVVRTALTLAFLVAEVGFLLFGRGLAIHDRIFGTQVVLDAAPANFGRVAGAIK